MQEWILEWKWMRLLSFKKNPNNIVVAAAAIAVALVLVLIQLQLLLRKFGLGAETGLPTNMQTEIYIEQITSIK